MRKPTEAEEQYRKGAALLEKLVAGFPTDPEFRRELAVSYTNLGWLLTNQKKSTEPEELFRKGLTLQEKLTADFPAVPEYRRDLGGSYTNLAALLYGLGRRVEAEELFRKGLIVREKLAADFLGVPEYRRDLGGSYCNFGIIIRDAGKPAESLEWFDKAINTLAPILQAEPRDAAARQFLRNSHAHRAMACDRQGKYAEAIAEWNKLLELTPKEEDGWIRGIRAWRATSRVNAGQVAEAMSEVSELMKLSGWGAVEWYDFACVCAIASAKLADKNAEYADRAMELLQKAVKAGYKDAAHMKRDKDLTALHDRDDFKALLAGLEKQFPPKRELAPAPHAAK